MSSYTLYTYSASPATHPRLPVLDPAGLYVASLLRSTRSLAFDVQPPNVWLHKILPRLEFQNRDGEGKVIGSVLVAEGVRAIEKFVVAVDMDTGQRDLSSQGRLRALRAYVSAEIEPLVYCAVLFPSLSTTSSGRASGSAPASYFTVAKPVFDKVTFPAYAEGLSFPSSKTVPHRLREQCQAFLAASSATSNLHRALNSPFYEPSMNTDARQHWEEKQQMIEQMRSLRDLAGSSSNSRILKFDTAAKEEWKGKFVKERVSSAEATRCRPAECTSFVLTDELT